MTTALHLAVENIDDEETLVGVVQFLIEFGAKIDVKDAEGRIPLMKACEKGNMRAVKCLTTDVNAVDNEGWPVIGFATGSIDIIKYLIEKGANVKCLEDKEELLRKLIDDEQIEIIELFIEHGLPVETTVQGDETLFMYAFINGPWSICKTLLKKGADINCDGGPCPAILIRACQDNDDVGVMWLVDHGADVNAMYEGCPLLGWAIDGRRLNDETIDYLIDHGARMSRKKNIRKYT